MIGRRADGVSDCSSSNRSVVTSMDVANRTSSTSFIVLIHSGTPYWSSHSSHESGLSLNSFALTDGRGAGGREDCWGKGINDYIESPPRHGK